MIDIKRVIMVHVLKVRGQLCTFQTLRTKRITYVNIKDQQCILAKNLYGISLLLKIT